MPTTYIDGSATTDTILTLDSNYVTLMRCKVFFPGNGVDAYTVLSAFFTQDTHSVAVKVNGATTFQVPAFGRWSDYSSIVGFDVPGDIHLLTTCKYLVPIYADYTDGGGEANIPPSPDTGSIVMGEILTLNFEGEDGATTWVEEAQGLVPLQSDYCGIDTAQFYNGSSSLLMRPTGTPDARLRYLLPGLTDRFICTAYFRFSTSDWGSFFKFTISKGFWFAQQNYYVEVNLNQADHMHLYVGGNSNGASFFATSTTTDISPDVWHKLKITLWKRDVLIEIDDALVGGGTAPTYDFPMEDGDWQLGIQTDYHSSGATCYLWVDNVEIRTVPDLDIVEVTSTETITVTDNSLIQAGDTITITGTSA